MLESLVESMGSGYPAVVQRVLQMRISLLRVTVEPRVHTEPSGVHPNDES